MESDTERDVPLVAPAPNPSGHRPHGAAKSTAFKREERRRRKDRKRQERLALELARWEPLGAPSPRPASTGSSAQPEPDKPWPCDPPSPPEPSSWSWDPPATPGPPAVPPPLPTVAAASAPHRQAAAVRSCRAFFEAQIEDDGDDKEEQEGEEGNAARFFAELLGGDAALRGFYEAERDSGHFLCLVCEGTGARVGKRFRGCAALVQPRRIGRPDPEEARAPRFRRRRRPAARMGRRPDRASAGGP